MEPVKYGNCYQFDIPDDMLNEEEATQVIDALLFDLRRTPVGETFVLDVSIGPHLPDDASWQEFGMSRRRFQRAEFKKEAKTVTRDEVIQFLRDHFAELMPLPSPKLRRIK